MASFITDVSFAREKENSWNALWCNDDGGQFEKRIQLIYLSLSMEMLIDNLFQTNLCRRFLDPRSPEDQACLWCAWIARRKVSIGSLYGARWLILSRKFSLAEARSWSALMHRWCWSVYFLQIVFLRETYLISGFLKVNLIQDGRIQLHKIC